MSVQAVCELIADAASMMPCYLMVGDLDLIGVAKLLCNLQNSPQMIGLLPVCLLFRGITVQVTSYICTPHLVFYAHAQ